MPKDPIEALAAPLTATASSRPCSLYEYHWPRVIRTQFHHSKPVYLQNKVFGRIIFPADTWLCGSCHDGVHETIDWLLGEGREPSPKPGRKMLAEANRTVHWFREAMLERDL